MDRLKSKKIITTFILTILLTTSVFLITNKSRSYKEIPRVKLKENKELKEFALMLEQENGEYKESTGELPTEGYVFNKEKSGCIDINGKIIDDAIEYDYDNYILTLNIDKTSYCYLYYDKDDIKNYLMSKDVGTTLSNEEVGGMYRYQGLYTDEINNYICLGDNCCKTTECSADSNDDMYRIIGVTKTGELKVIKKTALNEALQWDTTINRDIKWPNSILYNSINGKSINDVNSYYYSLDENIKKIIVKNHRWLYGDTNLSGTSDEMFNSNKIYAIETGQEEAEHKVLKNEDVELESYWWNEYIEAPMGLLYIHDYIFAYPNGNPSNYTNALNSWIHISHNELNGPSNENDKNYEWTITRDGQVSTVYCNIRRIGSNGYISSSNMTNYTALRPTFYIMNNISITGDGTLENPFRII